MITDIIIICQGQKKQRCIVSKYLNEHPIFALDQDSSLVFCNFCQYNIAVMVLVRRNTMHSLAKWQASHRNLSEPCLFMLF